jgi:ribosomal protein S18 acetylase RimI-like enzyme
VVVVAERNGEVIGFASGGDSRDADGQGEAEVYAVYVSPEEWGEGSGRELMNALEGLIANGRSVSLWVLAENRGAIGFYDAIGYAADGMEKEISIGGRKLVEVRMRKDNLR